MLFSVQCAKPAATPTEMSTTPTLKLDNTVPSTMLPIYETERERETSGKADQYDDFKAQNYQFYELTQPPTSTNLRFAGEFEPMKYIAVGWTYGTLNAFFVEIIMAAWGTSTVMLLNDDAATITKMKTMISDALKAKGIDTAQVDDTSKLVFVNHPLDSIWMRDYGPQFVIDKDTGKASIIDTRYYHQRTLDDAAPTAIGNFLNVNVFRPDIKQEGGNLLANGEGVCFTTNMSLWGRNDIGNGLPDPNPSEQGHRDLYKKYFGCQELHILQPMEGDSLGHIDMFMALVGPRDIVVGRYDQADDCIGAATLDKNAAYLESLKDDQGKQKYRVHRVPMPTNAGDIWHTYTNIAMVRSKANPNKGVLMMPTYKDFAQKNAEATTVFATALKAAHPTVEWKIVPILSDQIIPWAGAIHCVTHEIPEAIFAKLQAAPAPLCGAKSHSCTKTECDWIPAKGVCLGNNLVFCASQNGKKFPWFSLCGTPCHLVSSNDCEQGCGEVTVNGNTYNDCTGKFVCQDNTGCTHECSANQTGCLDDGTSFVCKTNDKGCRVKEAVKCTNGQTCSGNKCQDPGAGCGDVTFGGYCEGSKVIWCEENKVREYDCGTQSKTCGPSGEIMDCVDGTTEPCKDECTAGSKGCNGNKSWACQKSRSTGCLIKAETDCGNDTCQDGACTTTTQCQNECTPGDKGCNGNTAWACLLAPEGCYRKAFATCDSGDVCDAGACKTAGCQDECQLGEIGCSNDVSKWVCMKSNTSTCNVKVVSQCSVGAVCGAGICKVSDTGTNGTNNGTNGVVTTGDPSTLTNKSGGGCTVNTGTTDHTGTTGGLALFGLMLLWFRRRRTV